MKTFIGYMKFEEGKTGNAVEIKTNILTSESDQRENNIKKEA